MGPDIDREEQAIRGATDRLIESFADTHSAAHVETTVAEVHGQFDGHAVRDFVPILVERMARRRLTTAEPPPAAAEPVQPEPEAPQTVPAEPDAAPAVAEEPAAAAASPRFRLSATWLVGLAAAVVVVVVAVVLAITLGGSSKPAATVAAPLPPPLTTVHGVVGSEKLPFFTDPRVVAAFAHDGLRVDVDAAGSRQIATSVDLTKYDFAFPSSEQSAERILRQRPGSTTKYTPFSSPMAIATFTPIVDLLTRAGIVKPGPVPTFDMSAYLNLVGNGTRWDQLDGNTAYPVDKNVLISTTDPRKSNSAAMYLAVASYVANGNTIVSGSDAVQAVLPAVSPLFVGQGYTEDSSEGPFKQYLTDDMGSTPMVWIYEAQYVDATVHGQIKPDMVLMYPSPTVLSEHTLVPLNATGDKVGQLLSSDPTLQRLAAEHGFRAADPTLFAKVVADHNVPVAPALLDIIETPTYDTLEQLLTGVSKSYN